MSGEQARETVSRYLDVLNECGDFAAFFSEEVTFALAGTDQETRGPQATEELIRYFHETAFDASIEIRAVFGDDRRVALEADFVGTHVGEFQGVAATGNSVRVPYAVVYDVDDDRIAALRVYLPLHALVAQITTSPVSARA
jgi:steroid delta-isomerase-like uncharacterized protein